MTILTIVLTVIDLIEILNPIGNSVVAQIQQNLASTGSNASGETSRSLKYTVTQEGTNTIFQITGRPYFMTVETGRGPTKSGTQSSPSLFEQIVSWMASKGVSGSAYAIEKSIHKHGTKLYRSGGRKDIVSSVINQSLYDQIAQAVLKKFVNQYIVTIDNGNKQTFRA
jgi:hypothetical protein